MEQTNRRNESGASSLGSNKKQQVKFEEDLVGDHKAALSAPSSGHQIPLHFNLTLKELIRMVRQPAKLWELHSRRAVDLAAGLGVKVWEESEVQERGSIETLRAQAGGQLVAVIVLTLCMVSPTSQHLN